MKFDFWTMYTVVFLGFAVCNELTFIFKAEDVIEGTLRIRAELPLADLAYVKYIMMIVGLAALGGVLFNNPYKEWYMLYMAIGLIHYALVRIWPPLDISILFTRLDGITCGLILIGFILKILNRFPVYHETTSHQA